MKSMMRYEQYASIFQKECKKKLLIELNLYTFLLTFKGCQLKHLSG